MIQDTAGHIEDSGRFTVSPRGDCSGSKVDILGAESRDAPTELTEEQRHQLLVSHGLTSDEVESQLENFLQIGTDPMQTDYPPELAPAGSSSSGDCSSGGVRNTRTTITTDNIAPETLMNVMQTLINAKAKVRLETE